MLRPRALREAFRAHHNGNLPESGFRAVQDEAVRAAIALQEEAGLQAITDGEFRRPSYWARFVERVEGLEIGEALFRFHNADGIETGFTAPHVVAPVRRTNSIAGDEFQFLHANTDRTAKITLPSPPTMHFWRLGQGINPAAYGSEADFFADLAAVYQAEFADLSKQSVPSADASVQARGYLYHDTPMSHWALSEEKAASLGVTYYWTSQFTELLGRYHGFAKANDSPESAAATEPQYQASAYLSHTLVLKKHAVTVRAGAKIPSAASSTKDLLPHGSIRWNFTW